MLASAAVEVSPATVLLNVNYERFDDDDLRTIPVDTDSFTITNPAAQEVTVTITAAELPAEYTAETKTITVAANGTSSTTLKINVPHRADAGEKSVGVITITEPGTVTRVPLAQKTKSMLSLEKIRIVYTSADGNDEEDNFKDEEDPSYELTDRVQPGTEVVITFSLENLFDSNYDEDQGTLEEVQLTIEPDDDDFIQGSFEEDYDVDNIDLSDSAEVEVRFTVSEEADEDSFSLDITIEAEDGEGASYKIEKELNLEVERKNNDLRITEAKLAPETITACDESFTLDLKVKNFGTNDQREAAVAVYNQKLDINENIANLRINDYSSTANSWQKKFTFVIKPGTKEGIYPLAITTFINKDDHADDAIVNGVIGKCAGPGAATITENTTAPPALPAVNTGASGTNQEAARVITTTTLPPTGNTETDARTDRISSAAIVNTIEDPYAKEDYLIAALVVAIVAVLTLIVLFFIILLK